MLKIVSVEFDLESFDIPNVSLEGPESFLDADVLITKPSSIGRFLGSNNCGLDGVFTLFSRMHHSDLLINSIKRRNFEILSLLDAGKLVVTFLDPLVYIDAEIRNTSKFLNISNYSMLPLNLDFFSIFSNGVGKTIKLVNDKHIFAPYYRAFSNELEYKLFLNKSPKPLDIFLVNKLNNPVAWSLKLKEGYIFFIPPPPVNCDIEKLHGVIIQCVKNYFKITIETPEPVWAKAFVIPGEESLTDQINEIQRRIDELLVIQLETDDRRKTLLKFRGLLYETGKPLEDVVINAFKLMDFKTERFEKDDMEHDIIIESREGRIVCEVEGKDKVAINIDKLDQLQRVFDEDFSINGKYSEALLIGNPHRLFPLDQRKNPFTDKVLISARRKQFKLLTTVELFKAVVKILENPDDDEYKKKCRISIFQTTGEIIKF